MIIAAGLELASVGESLNTSKARDIDKYENPASHGLDDAERKRRWTVMLVTAGLLLAFKNDAIGFIAGMCCHWSYWLHARLARSRTSQRAVLSQNDQERLLGDST